MAAAHDGRDRRSTRCRRHADRAASRARRRAHRRAALRRGATRSTRRRCCSTGSCRRCGAPCAPTRARRLCGRVAARCCRCAPACPRRLALRDYLPREPHVAARRASGVRRCGLLDFQDAMLGARGLRPRLAGRGRAPRRAEASARAMIARYLAAFPAPRPRRLRSRGRGDGRAAPRARDRRLHAALEARRQAASTCRTFRASGACSSGRSRIRASRRSGAGSTRTCRRRCAARPTPPMSAARHRLGRDASRAAWCWRRASACACGPITDRMPEAAGAGRRAHAARPRARSLCRGRDRRAPWSTPITWRTRSTAHLKTRARPAIVLSHEPELLETGGGVLNALPLLGEAPFFVANSDALWLNGPLPGAAAARARLERRGDGRAAARLGHSRHARL